VAVVEGAVSEVFRAVDLTGVFANAVLGGVIARHEGLDPVGFAALAIMSGLGGGAIRDTLLQHGTPIALTDYAYLLTALGAAALTFVVHVRGPLWDQAWPVVDAVALGTWAATGAQKTLAVGLGWLPAVLLGTITAVGGGAVRDIVLRRVPTVLGGNTLYATCAVAASAVMVALSLTGHPTTGLVAATLTGAALCLLARRRGWILPQGDSWSPSQVVVRSRDRLRVRVLGRRQRPDLKEKPMTAASPVSAVLAGLPAVRGWQEDFYRDLHADPELSHQERRTAAAAAARLNEFGFQVHEGVGGTGVVGLLANGAGPTVLLRADMDALPVREATGLPYASTVTATDDDGTQVPVMHACGHDAHVTCLLGAAALLAQGRERWAGTLVALFQPAEETGDGARGMVADGLADLVGPVSVALGQHVLPMPAGQVGTRRGAVLSAADSLRITVHGRGGHGSMPQATVDPVVLAAMIVVRLQTIIAREVPPDEPAVLTIGSIQAGTKSNIISDHAVLQVNIRSYSDQTRRTILDAIHRIVTAECQASGSPSPPQFELFDRYPLTDNDPAATDRVADALVAHFGERAVRLPLQTASEDFSDIPTALGVPYTYWGIGGTDPDTYRAAETAGTLSRDIPVNHSARFAPVIQPTLDTGTEALVTAALAWLAPVSAPASAPAAPVRHGT
jgi:amidohydrolase